MDELTIIANQEGVLTLPTALDAIWESLRRTAASNVATAAGDDLINYTQIEQRAMLLTEMLNQSKGLDLASVMLKGRIVAEIEQDGLFSVHPAGYNTLEQLAIDQGVGVSELSQIRDLTKVIFPYLQETLGLDIYTVWESIGKSNMRELVPVLKRVITGEQARGTVEATYLRVKQDVEATLTTAGLTYDTEGLKRAIVEKLLEGGEIMTNADLRQTLRPDRVPSINAHLLVLNGEVYLLAHLTDRQEQMVARRLHGYWDAIRIPATTPRAEVRTLLRQYPALDEILGLEAPAAERGFAPVVNTAPGTPVPNEAIGGLTVDAILDVAVETAEDTFRVNIGELNEAIRRDDIAMDIDGAIRGPGWEITENNEE